MQLSVPVIPAQAGRIDSLDAIRGVALGGVLLVNMGLFSFPALYLDPLQYWSGNWNKGVALFISFIGEGKFVSMFSFLFGLGFTLFLRSAEKKGLPPVTLFLRRLLVLLGIGMIHAHFIWFGDVLCFYSVFGAILLLFRNKSPESLLKWALGLLVIPVVLFVLAGTIIGPVFFEDVSNAKVGYTALDIYRSGSFRQLWAQNGIDLLTTRIGYLMEGPVIFAMFLLGAYSGKRQLFRHPDVHMTFFRQVQLWGAVIGWPVAVATLLYTPPGPGDAMFNYLQVASTYIAGPAIGIFYIATLTRLLQSPRWQEWMRPFQAAGKMAATNYLMQSVCCVSIYYSFGGGLYGYAGPATIFLIWLLLFSIQLVISSWWMSHFRFGPVEWIWRRLTYGKWYTEK
ncbi:DUF418 domain-containing protein [Chitinophaga flava]|nr:DUF418 domain-containing protein [Chitinophaga flava]